MNRTYEIIFDGGSKGNPGKGYGSYVVLRDGGVIAHNPEDYGDGITNNQAEYMTLVRALRWLATELGADATNSVVTVRGDSQLVIRQLRGEWKIKDTQLRALAMEARQELGRFASVSVDWHPRAVSVQWLGH